MAVPVANFIANNLTPTTTELVTFTDLSTNIPTSRYRDFGDGFTSVLQNPTHTYLMAGVYTVILIATNADGSDAETKTGYITVSNVNPQSFYGPYFIDDSQIGCGRIIAVDCNGLHYYANPCDLIEDCIEQLPQQLVKQCIVDFFNITIDTIPAGYVLRVDGSHCLEAVPLQINDTDELVAVSATDTPGYLGAKVVGCVNGGREIEVTPIGPMGNQQLQICIDPPDHVMIAPGDPSCDDAILRGDMDGSLHRDCGDSGNDSYRAERYTPNDIHLTPPTLVANRYKAYIFTNALNRNGTALQNVGNMNTFRGNTDMQGVGPYDGMIRIPKTGMYDVRMKGEAIFNRGVSRVRLFVIQPDVANSKVLIDCKYGGEEGIGSSIVPAPYQYVVGGTTYGLESMTVTFTGHSMLYFVEGQYIALGCKIDARDTNSYAPDVLWRKTVYELYDQNPGQGVSEINNLGPGLMFGIRFVSPHSHGFTY